MGERGWIAGCYQGFPLGGLVVPRRYLCDRTVQPRLQVWQRDCLSSVRSFQFLWSAQSVKPHVCQHIIGGSADAHMRTIVHTEQSACCVRTDRPLVYFQRKGVQGPRRRRRR
eukprot:scaffold22687_cov112-Isochrysis_galbana.AAC.1